MSDIDKSSSAVNSVIVQHFLELIISKAKNLKTKCSHTEGD